MKNKILSIALLTAAVTLPTEAGVVSYATLSDWQSAGTVTGTLTFAGVAITPNSVSQYAIPPFTFASANSSSFLSSIDATSPLSIYGPGSGTFLTSPSPLNIIANTSLFGLSFDFNCYGCNGSDATVTVTTSAGNSSFLFPGTGHTTFLGVRSDLAIQNIQVAFSGSVLPFVGIDNVGYSDINGASTPEPASLLMIGGGLAFIAQYRRRLSRSSH